MNIQQYRVILITINGQTIRAISSFSYLTAFKLNDGSWEIRKTDTIFEPGIPLQSDFWKSVTEINQYRIGSQDYVGLVKNDGTLMLAKQKSDLSPRQLLVAAIFEELLASYTGQEVLKSVEQELLNWFKAYPQNSSVRSYVMSFFHAERPKEPSTSSSSYTPSSTSACDPSTSTNASISATASMPIADTPVQAPIAAPTQTSTLRSVAAKFLSWVSMLNPFGNS